MDILIDIILQTGRAAVELALFILLPVMLTMGLRFGPTLFSRCSAG
jgi:hypothetical protein